MGHWGGRVKALVPVQILLATLALTACTKVYVTCPAPAATSQPLTILRNDPAQTPELFSWGDPPPGCSWIGDYNPYFHSRPMACNN
jgi:hypothetical protein